MLVSTNTCIWPFKYTTATLQSLHPGTSQCKSLQLQASRVTKATATVQPNCVHKGCSKVGSVNTTLTSQSGQVPGQGANTGLHLQLHAEPIRNRLCLPVYNVRAKLGCVVSAVLFSRFRSGCRCLICCTDQTVIVEKYM